MIPEKGQHLKIVLKTGLVVEGIVEEWLQHVQVRLRSLDDQSILIIADPKADIMLIKIMLDPPEEVEEDETPPKPPAEVKSELEDKFQKKLQEPSNPYDDIRNKSLAELKIELAKQEKQLIAEKLREHRPTAYAPSTTPYHYPSVVTTSRSAYQPAKVNHGPRPTKKPRPQ